MLRLDGDWKDPDVDDGWGLKGIDPDGDWTSMLDGDWKGWIRMGIGRRC